MPGPCHTQSTTFLHWGDATDASPARASMARSRRAAVCLLEAIVGSDLGEDGCCVWGMTAVEMNLGARWLAPHYMCISVAKARDPVGSKLASLATSRHNVIHPLLRQTRPFLSVTAVTSSFLPLRVAADASISGGARSSALRSCGQLDERRSKSLKH